MQRTSSYQRWIVAGVVACGIVGLVLMATDPGDRQPRPARRAPAPTARVARPVVREMVEETPPPALDDRLPEPLLDAVPVDEVARPPRHLVVVPDAAGFAPEPPRAMFALGRTLPRPAAVEHTEARPERAVVEPDVARRPRRKHRRPSRRRQMAEQRAGGGATTGSTPAGDTPAVPPPSRTVGAAAPAVPIPDDVAFHSGDAVLPTGGQVAIPVDGKVQHEGSLSLMVQPGWEHDNADDATLVQLGDEMRLTKNVHFLRLEGVGDDTGDGPRGRTVGATGDGAGANGVGVPISDWNPGEWHHVTATWSEDTMSLYVDGELVGRKPRQGRSDAPAESELLVGTDASDSKPVPPGLIGRVALRGRVLGDDEVAQDYHDAIGDGASGDAAGSDHPAQGGGGHSDDRGNGGTDHGNDAKPARFDHGHSHAADHGAAR